MADVDSYAQLFPYFPIASIKTISFQYYSKELTRYIEPNSIWRPCVNGKIDPANPLSGCISTRIIGGLDIPLREFAFPEEHLAGKSESSNPRPCVLCIIASVRARTRPHNIDTIAACGKTHTIQPFMIDPTEWPPNTVMYPSNHKGVSNGLCAPFPDYDSRMLCTIDPSVNPLYLISVSYCCRGIFACPIIQARLCRRV